MEGNLFGALKTYFTVSWLQWRFVAVISYHFLGRVYSKRLSILIVETLRGRHS